MQPEQERDQTGDATAAQFAVAAESDDVRAWEQVDTDRYMPRRIKGSCKGRALG